MNFIFIFISSSDINLLKKKSVKQKIKKQWPKLYFMDATVYNFKMRNFSFNCVTMMDIVMYCRKSVVLILSCASVVLNLGISTAVLRLVNKLFLLFEPRHEKTNILHMRKQRTAKLISAFVFAT